MRWMQYQMKLCAVILALLSVGLARSKNTDEDQELLNRLLAQIEEIPMVDTHSHFPWPTRDAQQFKDPDFHYDVSWLLGSTTYVG